jgi:hypothetical protein
MQELIWKRDNLTLQIAELARAAELWVPASREEERSRNEEFMRISGQKRAIEATIFEIRAHLCCEVIQHAMSEVSSLGSQGKCQQAGTLTQAALIVTRSLYKRDGFLWEEIARVFEQYQAAYARQTAHTDYSGKVLGIQQRCKAFLRDYCKEHNVEEP